MSIIQMDYEVWPWSHTSSWNTKLYVYMWRLGNTDGHNNIEVKGRSYDTENINVWNGHYYFIQMPFLRLKKWKQPWQHQHCTCKNKPWDHRWFKWDSRAYAKKPTCVTASSKQWICGKLGMTLAFLEHSQFVLNRESTARFFIISVCRKAKVSTERCLDSLN